MAAVIQLGSTCATTVGVLKYKKIQDKYIQVLCTHLWVHVLLPSHMRMQVERGRVLGKGAFGISYEGRWRGARVSLFPSWSRLSWGAWEKVKIQKFVLHRRGGNGHEL